MSDGKLGRRQVPGKEFECPISRGFGGTNTRKPGKLGRDRVLSNRHSGQERINLLARNAWKPLSDH